MVSEASLGPDVLDRQSRDVRMVRLVCASARGNTIPCRLSTGREVFETPTDRRHLPAVERNQLLTGGERGRIIMQSQCLSPARGVT